MVAETKNSSFPDCLFGSEYDKGKEYFWISGILLVICGTIGLVGNIFSMAVLCRPKMRRHVFYKLLLALACFDTLFILTFGISHAYKSLACPPDDMVDFLFYPVREIFLVGSIYMTLAVSVERYLGICHPHIQFSRGSLTFILPVVIISFVFTFPRFLEMKYSFVNHTLNAEWSLFRDEKQYEIGYFLLAEVIFKTIIPLLALLFLNGSIIKKIKGGMNLPRALSRQDENATKILLCIVLVFLILHTPAIVYKCMFFLGYKKVYSWYWVIPVSRLAITINSSVNFVIYCMVGKKFRGELVQVFQYNNSPVSNTISGDGEEQFS